MTDRLPPDWIEAIGGRLTPDEIAAPMQFVTKERSDGFEVFPPAGRVFTAFEMTPFKSVRAVILGQDPYHGKGQADGLAFSTAYSRIPPSLHNIFVEYCDDLGLQTPRSGSLEKWARNGVLLLNSVLTVREGRANSHAGRGWEELTRSALTALTDRSEPIVFLLWGKKAQRLGADIDGKEHIVIPAAHPSPLSANRGFFDSRPFSTANDRLRAQRMPPIAWRLA